jgi:anti-anti-sigma factor
MNHEILPIRVQVENEEVIVIVPIGEIDAFTSVGMRQLVTELLSYEPLEVMIDLSSVDFLDVSGLRVLVDAGRQLDGYGGRLTIRGASHFQRMTLHLVRANEVARLVP